MRDGLPGARSQRLPRRPPRLRRRPPHPDALTNRHPEARPPPPRPPPPASRAREYLPAAGAEELRGSAADEHAHQHTCRATATATPTRTPTNTPTATATATPANDGIHGRVTYKGAAAPGIELQLRFYDGSKTTTAATTTTDSEGRYRFTAAASLGSGQEYWVRFLSPDNPAYVSSWQTASITAYTSGSTMPGGDFDIADVILLSPPDDAAQALPVTFTWQPRGIPGDTYRVVFFDLDTDDYWYTEDLGNVGSFTATEPVAGCGLRQGIWLDGLGVQWPRLISGVVLLSDDYLPGGQASSPATPEEWRIGEGPRK